MMRVGKRAFRWTHHEVRRATRTSDGWEIELVEDGGCGPCMGLNDDEYAHPVKPGDRISLLTDLNGWLGSYIAAVMIGEKLVRDNGLPPWGYLETAKEPEH